MHVRTELTSQFGSGSFGRTGGEFDDWRPNCGACVIGAVVTALVGMLQPILVDWSGDEQNRQ